MLNWMVGSRGLGQFVVQFGGADGLLFGGGRTTSAMSAEITVETGKGQFGYRFTLARTRAARLIFADEAIRFSHIDSWSSAHWSILGDGGPREAQIVQAAKAHPSVPNAERNAAQEIVSLLRNCVVEDFHGTAGFLHLNTVREVDEINTLRSRRDSLAAVLHRLENEDFRRFEMICWHISRLLPAFERFQIDERHGNVLLRWKAKGADRTFDDNQTSDGSLRIFALVTLLNLPREMLPDVLILDGPELGLHPSAMNLIGNMIKGLALDIQVIVSTQSPLIVELFDVEEVFAFEAAEGSTAVRSHSTDDFSGWLADGYSTGELWEKNLLGGRP